MVTSLTPWTIGQRLKASLLNRMIDAITELQGGTGSTRPQLRVYAPSGTITVGGSYINYVSVRRDSHAGFDATFNTYTVPVDGLYHIAIAWKSATAVSTNPRLVDTATSNALLTGANSSGAANTGGFVAGYIDLTAGQEIAVQEATSTYTPFNDPTSHPGTGSNYWHVTYVGPST